jgi:virulence factor
VLGDGHKHRVVDLAQIWQARAGNGDDRGVQLLRRGDWTHVSTQRGFTDMCAEFLAAVREGRVLSERDALRTHEICEDVVRHAEARIGR